MATAAPGGMNPAYLLDPSLYGGQQQVDQQQAIANLLLQQGLAPLGGTEMAGQVAIKRSPVEGIAKLAALLSGQNLQQTANQAQMVQAMRMKQSADQNFPGLNGQPQPQQPQPDPAQTALAQGAAQGSVGPTNANAGRLAAALGAPPQQPPPQPQPQGLNFPGQSPQNSYLGFMEDTPGYLKDLRATTAPTDATKMAAQAHQDPVAANVAALMKSNTDPKILAMKQAGFTDAQIFAAVYGEAAKNAEIDRKAGNQFSNPLTGASGMVPKIADNANPVGSPLPNGALPAVAGIPGAPGVVASNERSQQGGKVFTGVPGSNGAPQSGFGADLFGGSGSPTADAEALRIARQELATMPPGPQRDQQVAAIARMQGGGSPVPNLNGKPVDLTPRVLTGQSTVDQSAATQAGALPQKTLEDRFTQLRDANGQAETTNSYLQNIKDLSGKASTGQFADKLQYVNSLLSPFSERATDAVTANNLLDKYSNQIVARLGQGGLGTDAARSILQSAYPNSHMTKDAINDAADNLMGANKMIQAKARLLSPIAASRDPAAYQKQEQAFDQAADPRIFQIANMPAAQAQKFLAGLSPDVQADLRKRAAALKQLGAF